MNCLPCLKGYPTNLYQDLERVMHSSRASSLSTSSHHRLREQQQGMETLRQACTQIAGVKPQGGSDTEVVFESSPQSSSGGTSTSSGRLREQSRMMEQVKHSAYITRRQRVLIIYHLLDVSHDATRNSQRFNMSSTRTWSAPRTHPFTRRIRSPPPYQASASVPGILQTGSLTGSTGMSTVTNAGGTPVAHTPGMCV